MVGSAKIIFDPLMAITTFRPFLLALLPLACDPCSCNSGNCQDCGEAMFSIL